MISKKKFKKLLPFYIDCAGSLEIRGFLHGFGCKGINGLGERVLIDASRNAHAIPVGSVVDGLKYFGEGELLGMMREPTKEELIAKKELKLSKAEGKVVKLVAEIEGLKKPEFEYPMFFESLRHSKIVKFSAIKCGEVVKEGCNSFESLGYESRDYDPHTDKSEWKQIPHDKETGFYDGEIVICWDDEMPCIRIWKNDIKAAIMGDNIRPVAWNNYAHLSELDSVLKKIAEQQKGSSND